MRPRAACSTRPRPSVLACAAVLLTTLSAPARTVAEPVGTAAQADASAIPSPFVHFGFHMGEDGQLAGWQAIQAYFARVDALSDRVRVVDIGPSTEGRRMIAALVSAPENMSRLADIQAANRRLADPRTLNDDEVSALVDTHKAVLAIGCSIHASEIGATQTANELLYELATSTDPRTTAVLRDVIIVLIPSLNPDGHDLVVDWYNRNRGTAFEGAPMPWLYHKYAGHDINRDAFMLNLQENRNIARFFYGEWHPQVFLAMHQMGSKGPRAFVPPNYDPIDANYDPMIWRTAGLLGSAMALEMERDSRAGVVSNALFDYYWPGYEDSAPLGHNTVCLLTELASAAVASPVTVQATELTGSPLGLSEYRPQINFPNPWPGGIWRLRDIVDYEMSALHGLMTGVARYRADIVRNFYAMGRRAIDRGERGRPFAWIVPPEQPDSTAAAALVNLLADAKVEVRRSLEPFSVGAQSYPAGTVVIPMAQPFRAYAKTLLESQSYPARRLVPGAPPERPYDVTGWSLPLQMNVRVDAIAEPFEIPPSSRVDRAELTGEFLLGERRPGYYLVEARGTTGTLVINRLLDARVPVAWSRAPVSVGGQSYAAGSLVVKSSGDARKALESIAQSLGVRVVGVKGSPQADTQPLFRARVGLYKPWLANIDEGWTRLLLERFNFPYESITPREMASGDLRTRFDVIVLPDEDADRLDAGLTGTTVPPEYTGGLGQSRAALDAFVQQGGTIVALDSACQWLIDAFALPVVNVARGGTDADRIYAPGSIVRIETMADEPLTFGLPAALGGFFASSMAFDAASGGTNETPALAVRPVARYAASDVLMSGWLEGGARLSGKAAALDVTLGRGRLVLLGFRVQHRAQAYGTFRFLFNALYSQQPPPRPPRR
ncbi:MAG: M14 metallopeptidase family protein [Vicinamibacterales bacterium]